MKRKKLIIGLVADAAHGPERIKRSNAATIAQRLSKMQLQILQTVFIDHKGIKRISKKSVDGLCAMGIIRKDLDLLSGAPIYVLERGGKMVCDEIKRKGQAPAAKKSPRVVIKIDRHVFGEVIMGGSTQPCCSICNKAPQHPVHIADGKFLCPSLAPGERGAFCLNEVTKQGEMCSECRAKAEAWRKAEAIRMTPTCPNCGGSKAVPPSSASSVDGKCYQRLTPELKHGLFKQHGEPEYIFRVRYPVALKAALDYLRLKPTSSIR